MRSAAVSTEPQSLFCSAELDWSQEKKHEQARLTGPDPAPSSLITAACVPLNGAVSADLRLLRYYSLLLLAQS